MKSVLPNISLRVAYTFENFSISYRSLLTAFTRQSRQLNYTVEAADLSEINNKLPLSLVFAGAPIPDKYNPYIILVTSKPLVSIIVDIDEAESVSKAVIKGPNLGWRFDLAIKAFVDTLASRLEQPLVVTMRYDVEGVDYPPAASIYAISTLAIVKTLSDYVGYRMTDEEILQAASSLDEEAGVWFDYIDGLRYAILKNNSIIYRHGEKALDLNVGATVVLELVGEEDIGEDLSKSINADVINVVTRLAGIAVIRAVQQLKNGDPFNEVFRFISRVDNALYYMLYGANLPPEGCKWTPSLQRVYGVCVHERNLGNKVEFML